MATRIAREKAYSFRKIQSEISDENISDVIVSGNRLQCTLTNVSAGVGNHLVHIISDEIPTMRLAILEVIMNGSILHDEIICQRLGLLPIIANADDFSYMATDKYGDESTNLMFTLTAECPASATVGKIVTSSDLQWVPIGSQAEKYRDSPPKPLYSDVKLFTLTSGQKVDLVVYAAKGTGRIHAGWRPVSTVSCKPRYLVEIDNEVPSELVQELVAVCPKQVFDIEDGAAIVKSMENCSMCRECQDEKFIDYVKLSFSRTEKIVKIASMGAIPPKTLLDRAVDFLNNHVDNSLM